MALGDEDLLAGPIQAATSLLQCTKETVQALPPVTKPQPATTSHSYGGAELEALKFLKVDAANPFLKAVASKLEARVFIPTTPKYLTRLSRIKFRYQQGLIWAATKKKNDTPDRVEAGCRLLVDLEYELGDTASSVSETDSPNWLHSHPWQQREST